MASPTVETFEHDIASEIRQKEASITDIASAVGDIGNNEEEIKSTAISPLVSIVVIVILCGLAGAGYAGYYLYQKDSQDSIQQQHNIATQQPESKPGIKLSGISPALDQAIGTFLTNIQKTNLGYSMTVVSYSPVFAYMLKNENAFGEDLGLALGNSHTLKKINIAQQATTATTSSTSTGTSTATSSTTTTQDEESLPDTYIFYDVTISNQNMRVAKSVYGTVVYAFIGNQRLVISSSTEGILAFRANLLRK